MKRPVDDSEKLGKFIKGQIVLYDIEVSNGNTYNFDTVPEAKELAEKIRYCYDNQIPMTIYEYSNDVVYYTESLSDNSRLNLIRVSNDIEILGYIQTYDDRIEITITEEEILTKDNVKTLFDNKSIVGTGNIDLYMHNLNLGNGSNVWHFQFISSNNLIADSLQDLTTLIKPTNNQVFIPCIDENAFASALLTYSNNVWSVDYQGGSSNITTVIDIVKTI